MEKSLHGSVPSIDLIMRLDSIAVMIEQYGRELVTEGVRRVIDDIRVQIPVLGEKILPLLDEVALATEVSKFLESMNKSSLRSVYNLTGTVLHTNLGRAVMANEAIDAMVNVAKGASNLEYDLVSGRRGDRDSHLNKLLCKLTGAEAATVVNNNAAAVLLVLNTLGRRKEVLVSRGELVEIGGSFRIPDIMSRAGCKLVEVGTTNRTHLEDYADAIGDKTAILMKVHTSNYAIEGFTANVTSKKLSELAKSSGLCVIEDLGSGTLINMEDFGLPHEPTVSEAIDNGIDIVMFSGDKLLGGPQAGLIVGKRNFINKVNKNPMKRAMRLDKITIAGLTATLQLYLNPDKIAERIPTIRMLARKPNEISAIAERVLEQLLEVLGSEITVKKIECDSQIGSGSLPLDRLPSVAISISPSKGKSGGKLKRYSKAFRALPIPVIGRIQDDAFILDIRCLEDVDGFISQLCNLEI